MVKKYITPQEFHDFKDNQDKLIDILNHNVTKLSVDVAWLKKINAWQLTFLGAICASVVGGAIKYLFL